MIQKIKGEKRVRKKKRENHGKKKLKKEDIERYRKIQKDIEK